MGNRDRDDTGRFADGIDPEVILEVFEARDDHARPITATDVVEELGIARRTAHNKLEILVERGEIETRKVGARGRVWWTPIRDADALDASDSDATVGRDGAETQPSGQRDESDTQPTEATDDALNAAINGLETTDDRREAVHACIAHLRKHTEAKKSDFTEEVYPDHNARYSSEGGWWNKIGKEYLQAVAGEVDPLKPPAGEGSHVWRWEV